MSLIETLMTTIRTVPDFPKAGIQFKDITPILQDPALLVQTADTLAKPFQSEQIALVLGIESRGFLFATMMAERLGAGFIPVRKPGKLPFTTHQAMYELEYGTDRLEIHTDAIHPGQKVLIHDDVLATGGTAEAVGRLVEKMGGELVGYSFLLELLFLNGRNRLNAAKIESLLPL